MSQKMISNEDLWNMLRSTYPNFKNITSKATAETFSTRNFEALNRTERNVLNEFYSLSMQVILNKVDIPNAKDPFDSHDIGETYSMPYGGYIQRMAINTIKPVSPQYRDLENGSTVDMYKIRKADITERFFEQNFDYQSFVTIPDDIHYKQIFASEYGMAEYAAGITKALQNGYVIQTYTNKLETINAIINSTKHPLQNTQVVEIEIGSADPTAEELTNIWLSIKNTINAIKNAPQTGAFNAEGYETTQDIGNLRLLMKQGLISAMDAKVMLGAFNPDRIALPESLNIMEVPNFGGLQPYKNYNASDGTYSTPLYPVYNDLGEQIGYNEAEGQSAVTVVNSAVKWKDPNNNVLAVLMDKGTIFNAVQNPLTVQPTPYNVAGRYLNMYANAPGNVIAGDSLYTLVVFKRTVPTVQDVISI